MSDHHIVTCFLRNRGEVLLLRRADESGPHAGQWDAVTGHAEGDPDAAAREAIREQTGVTGGVTFVRAGEPFVANDREADSTVHPYLFDCESRTVETSDGIGELEWTSPTEIRRHETVDGLTDAYERVAPTVETVKSDTDHGSAWLSVCALAVLRNRAGGFATADETTAPNWEELAALARDLRRARPSMVVLENRINRAMTETETPKAVERSARAGIERAFDVDTAAASAAANVLAGTVVTLSRSGTVLETLRQADIERVVVAESRPACEGVGVAETLTEECSVTLVTDGAVAHVLAEQAVDSVLVGADAILADGSITNKVGTRGIAIAAAHEGVPTYVVASSDKLTPDTDTDARFESGARSAVYDGSVAIDVLNPTFDRTPAEFVTIVTEDGPLGRAALADRAERMAALASWTEEVE